MRLYAVTVIKIASPGKTTSHHASKFSLPAASSDPQVTISGGTPMPKKDNDHSARMADAIPKAMATMAGARALGNA